MKKLPSIMVQDQFGSIANIVKGGEPVAARRLVQFMDAMPSANPDAPNLT